MSVIQTAPQLSLSAIVIGELLAGFRQGTRFMQNQPDLDRFTATPRVRILDVDATTANRYSEIEAHLRQNGTPLPSNDASIAARAMQHGLQVVTFDKHFAKMPQVSTLVLVP